ncbi:MAG: Type-2 serine--tRNA ligase [Methanonatronarchaeales archaeon]|nr:Type-2 serine--tRNA ligase [Methanonatronarchaeales archaeon]
MDLRLEGRLRFSGDAAEAREDLEEVLEEIEGDWFKRGASEGGGASLIDWSLEGDVLRVELESDRYVRAHDALVRMVRPLAQRLGPEHHIGVREVAAESLEAGLDVTLGAEALDALEGLTEVEEASSDGMLLLRFAPLEESQLRSGLVDRVISFATELSGEREALAFTISKEEPGTVLAKSPERTRRLQEDVTTALEDTGWIKRFPAKGQWTYLPPYAALYEALRDFAIERIPEQNGFLQAMFPKLVPIEVMDDMRYLEGLPEGMYYSCTPERSPELFERFRNELRVRRDVPFEILEEALERPGYVLAPAQCEPFYQLSSHEQLGEDDLPVRLFDASGFTYRWEGGGSKGLDRVNEFQRIEMVWMDGRSGVEEAAESVLDSYTDALDDLGIEWYVEVGDDPFYLEGRVAEERDIEFPDVPKREIRAKVPYIEGDISVGSVNLHGDHFVEGFSIQSTVEEPLWTACCGIGLSRWVVAFLAHHGLDPDDWPIDVDLPETPTTQEWPRGARG